MRTPLAWAVAMAYVLLGCVFPVFAQTTSYSASAINLLPDAERHAALRTKAQHQGSVPLIVGLETYQVSKNLRGTAIQAVQQSVVEAMGPAADVRTFKSIPFLAVQADEGMLSKLLEMPEVSWIQEDEHYGVLLEESTQAIGAQAAWEYGGSGEGQVIAVIDTGVDSNHPFLAGKVVDEACFSSNYVSTSNNFESISLCDAQDESSSGPGAGINCDDDIEGCTHGTRVAGIVAGKTDSFSGVARDADLLAIQVFSRFENYCGSGPCARSWVSDQVAALDYVYQKKDSLNIAAVNMSLGGGHYTDEQTCDEVNPAMRILIEMLHEENIAVIAAAGNSGLTDGLVSPACLSSAISVGATTLTDNVATFSSSASFLDFLAPGQDITTSIPGGGYANSAGTSFSAPHVAGAWAILKGANPNASISEILSTFSNTGVQVTDFRNDITKSRIQVDKALEAANLPVDLVSFEATYNDDRIRLSWETASEINNAGFEIQQKVGRRFESVGYLGGQGTTTENTSYVYEVPNLPPGEHQFRLKQIDFDGGFAYSLVLNVTIDLESAVHFGNAYPNPFNPETQFTFTLAQTQFVTIEVYNLLGQRVLTLAAEELQANKVNHFTIDGSRLPSGVYMIVATGEQFRTVQNVTLLK